MIFNMLFEILGGIYYFALHVVNPGSFPPPLNAKKESELLEKNSKGDIDARNKLIEHNLRLVVYIAKRFENTGICIEDLISIGTLGLIKAIGSFCADKNIKVFTFGRIAIEVIKFLIELAIC